jgi:hypothetical protein
MNKTKYHYIHFPQSLLADVIERKEKALTEIIITFDGKDAQEGIVNCSCKLSMLEEFKNKKKTEKEWLEFLGFLAVKSILGTKKYYIANYKLVLSRMLGFKSYEHLENAQLNAQLNEDQKLMFLHFTRIDKANNERVINQDKMKRLLNHLEDNWKVINYSRFMKGFYIAMKGKTTYETLAKKCEERRETNRLKKINKAKKDAYLNIKATINPRYKSNEFE